MHDKEIAFSLTECVCRGPNLELVALSLHEIDTLTFFNVPLFIFLNEIHRGKQNIPRASYGRFNPYVFTFHLETETIEKFSILTIHV